ncbi:hypothetical protein H7171_00915 [Candidatus Saccharibacteria bacterium]|nr:hypothetical protein [Candidatus Saccharibacteria bacterium]
MLLAVFLFASPHVYARTDARGYFTGVNLNGPAYCANCDTGLDAVAPQPHGPGLPDGFNDTMDKAAFIRKVHEFNDSGIPKYQTAAALYVSLINGYKTSRPPNAGDFVNFEARVNNPAISIGYGYRSDVENSAYYVAGDDEVFFTESEPVGRYSMIFYDSTREYTVIKLDCGNPLGQLALPDPPPPDQPPVGAVDPPTCTISKGWAYDPDNRSASLYYYLYVNGVKNGPGTADKSSPDVNGIHELTGAHRIQDDLPSQGGWNPRIVNNIKYTAVDSETNLESAIGSPVSVGPCVTSNCAGDSFSYKFGVNQPVDIGAKVTITGGYGPPYSVSSNPAMYITVLNSSGIAVSGFSDKPVAYSVSPPPGTPGLPLTTLTSTGPSQVFSTSAPGIFTVTWRLGGSAPITCTDAGDAPAHPPTNHYAGFQPYFRIEDGDAAAGEGFGKSVCVPPPSSITGFNRYALGSGSYFGSGTNLAAIANGSITQFATGTDRGVAASASSNGVGQPRGLAFANGGINGGLFNNGSWCSADYYADAGNGSSTTPNLSITGKNVYQVTGNYTLNAATLQPGADITIKVNGDVSIAGDILYNYGSLDRIPRFRLLVTGNIYVQNSPAVTELHGFYVAQPKLGFPFSGKFYTCSNGISPINDTTPLNSYSKCNNQLNIIGSVSASTIIPGRTAGNYNDNSVTPAETFQNSPELWIFPATDAGSVGSINSYDSITNLPPVL